MKKVLSMLLAIVMVLSLMPVTALAADAPTIYLETDFTTELVVGDTFTVTANLKDNVRFDAMTLTLKWNENVVQFNGFEANARGIPTSDVFNAADGYSSANVNQSTGKIMGVDTTGFGYDNNGMLFVANFEIVGEGALDLGLKTDDPTVFQMVDNNGVDQAPTLDLSAIEDLTVGGKPVGPAIPEGAPFTAITTDAGNAVAIEDCGFLAVDPWGGSPVDTPYYHITIPADATEAYIRFDMLSSDFMSQSASDGTPEIGSAWAGVNDEGSGMAGLKFEDNGDHTIVIIPLEFNADPWGPGEMKSTVKTYNAEYEEYDLYYAVGPEDSSAAVIAVFSLEHAAEGGEEAPETYSITIDPNLVGGTLTATDENGEPITEAAAGDVVSVTITPASGYTGTSYTINGELANDFVFQMPAENVVLSATFTPIHTCSYTESVVDAKYLKTEATCQSGAVYYKSCECGEFAETAETFISGDPVDCVYEDGACKWCGEAEPVLAPGYRFATSADVSAENGGTAVVHVKITGHSDENVTSYNAYDVTLTFDSDKLEYVDYDGAVKSDNGSVTVSDNTIRIVGCGAGKDFGTEIVALTFKTKAEGAANVTISKVQVSDKEESVKEDAPEATPKHDEDDTTADETPDVSVVVVPYSVDKPDFISGNDKIPHGEDYTFSYTDTTNYTYSDLTVTVGDDAVENLVADENGVYTIEGVTGAIKITATQTPNSYDVNKPENVTGPDQATYGTPYIFAVTPSAEDMAIDAVKVTLADGTKIPYTINENGEYVIAGTNITGAFTITVTEKEKMTTVAFSGIEAAEIEGGLTQTAEIGKEFTFKLNKEEGYDYTVTVGETELTESEETEGQYTIPAGLVVKGGVAVTIEKVDNTKPVVDVAEYISLDSQVMFLVTAKWGDRVLAYGEEGTMYWSSKYTVTGEEEAGAYCWLVLSTDEMNTIELVKAAAEDAIVEAAEGATATAIRYDYDVNGTTIVDVNDAQLAYDMYNASYMKFNDNLPICKFLEADMETDSKLDTKDVAAIISYIISGANA